MAKTSNPAPSSSQPAISVSEIYLFLYSLVQLSLYTLVILTTLRSAFRHGSFSKVYDEVIPFLGTAQLIATLEMVHVLVRITSGSFASAFVQVEGRNLVLFGVLRPCLSTHQDYGYVIASMFISWGVSDVIRFAYYLIKMMEKRQVGISSLPNWLIQLRYSAFLVLYPTGILSEIGVVYFSLDYIKQNKIHFVDIPITSSYTFHFNFFIFCLCGLASYLYFGPMMLSYMIKQRTKYLKSREDAAKSQ